MVIRVNEAGTLPSLIASHLKYRIVELTLIGELNGTDLRYIREMSGCDANGKETGGCLSVFDLSGVNIVDGGNTYYGNYSASDNKIGDYTFYKCARLTRVIMPENLLSIGEGAFGCCYNLSSVVWFVCFRGHSFWKMVDQVVVAGRRLAFGIVFPDKCFGCYLRNYCHGKREDGSGGSRRCGLVCIDRLCCVIFSGSYCRVDGICN